MTDNELNVSVFKTRFPEYQFVSDTLVNDVLSESISEIGDCFSSLDKKRAQMLLTAHNLAMEGEPNRSNSIAMGKPVHSAKSGDVLELKDRDVSVKFADKQSSISANSNASEVSKYFSQTNYGQQYLRILRRNSQTFFAV